MVNYFSKVENNFPKMGKICDSVERTPEKKPPPTLCRWGPLLKRECREKRVT
jgi:hypothetical protein